MKLADVSGMSETWHVQPSKHKAQDSTKGTVYTCDSVTYIRMPKILLWLPAILWIKIANDNAAKTAVTVSCAIAAAWSLEAVSG